MGAGLPLFCISVFLTFHSNPYTLNPLQDSSSHPTPVPRGTMNVIYLRGVNKKEGVSV